jgi:hypothetical protein
VTIVGRRWEAVAWARLDVDARALRDAHVAADPHVGRVRFEVKSTDPRDGPRPRLPVQIDALDPAPRPGAWCLRRGALERSYGAIEDHGLDGAHLPANDGNTTLTRSSKDLLEDMDHDAAMVLGELHAAARASLRVHADRPRGPLLLVAAGPQAPLLRPGRGGSIEAVLGDPLETVYARMDRIGRRARDASSPKDVAGGLDWHFAPGGSGMNVNQWLLNEGYLVATATRPSASSATSSATGSPSGGIDWSRSKAYALGLGQIYLNRKCQSPRASSRTRTSPRCSTRCARGCWPTATPRATARPRSRRCTRSPRSIGARS